MNKPDANHINHDSYVYIGHVTVLLMCCNQNNDGFNISHAENLKFTGKRMSHDSLSQFLHGGL